MPASLRPLAAVATLVAGGLLVSGCASDPAPRPSTDQNSESTVTLMTYRCESGAVIRATYPTDSIALVRYRGETHQLQVTRAASGVRYVDDSLQWWTKGSGPGATAMLSERAEKSETIEHCEEVNSPDRA
ncbi:hypothetical protein SADO_14859 [Salinisphaera dokdonensis CL-ES53]|uniref:C-type lysozyme inhibitor domain-containing protein n=1 Tax=Salinisphaera dokdonensis CL-ES53 TaxID=1304272 RepID=A0ABV2B4I6_9GAMM